MHNVSNDTETNPPRKVAASTIEDEKAAIKRSLAEEARFREEKHRIVEAMGGSRAELVTPAVDSRLQRKLSSTPKSIASSSSLISQGSARGFQGGVQSADDLALQNEKAAIKRSMAEEVRFREEKQRIVQAMGGSRAELVAPSVDSRLQHKLSCMSSTGDSSGSSALQSQSSARGFQDPRADPEHPPDSDDLPIAFDHSGEHELYDVEEDRGNKVSRKALYYTVGVAVLLLLVGGVVGAVAAATGSGHSVSENSQGGSEIEGCTFNQEELSRCENGVLVVPECAREAFQELKEFYLSKEDAICDDAHQGLVALSVAQTNLGDEVDDPNLFFALSTLYFALEGLNWKNNEHWLEGSSPCSGFWYGVECSTDGSIDISLEFNDLKGSLSTEIGMLSSLNTLNLGRNEIEGTVPSEIGLLTGLLKLELHRTWIHSTLPSEIGALQDLTFLRLSLTQMVGPIPPEIGNLVNLVNITLTDTQFTGTLPPEMGNLVNLERFSLMHVHSLTGTMPSEWATMSSLSVFSIAAFGMDQSPLPGFLNTATNLKHLHLLSTDFTGSVDMMVHLTSLETLAVGYEALTGTIPTEIGSLSNLTALEIDFAEQLQGTLPTEVGLLTKLGRLSLRQTRLSGSLPSELAYLTKLTYLDLIDTTLHGSIPSELCTLEAGILIRTCQEGHPTCGIDSCTR